MVDSSQKTDSGRKLFYGLFIFPLIIAVGMAVLLCTVVFLTHEEVTPEKLISEIKSGSPSKRWQKAFELSNELNQGRGLIRGSGVMKEIMAILGDRKEYDSQTRGYMALALSRFQAEEAGPFLTAQLDDETDEHVQIYLMWAIGTLQVPEASGSLVRFLHSGSEELRKMSAYVVGVLGDKQMAPELVPLLEDRAQDVRWNAALSLARLGSSEGTQELLRMLDRKSLSEQPGLDDSKIEEIMVNAVKGLKLILPPQAHAILIEVSNSDPSLKVRQAALEAIDQYS